jgi:uncharacterized membrane protein YiaA
MSKTDKTLSYMLLILGLFLISIGIFLSTYTTMDTRTGWPNLQPYLGIGLIAILFGVVARARRGCNCMQSI